MIQQMLGNALPTASGVYYVVKYLKGWRLEPNKEDIDPQLDHLGLWEEISYLLVCQWAGKVGLSKSTLHQRLIRFLARSRADASSFTAPSILSDTVTIWKISWVSTDYKLNAITALSIRNGILIRTKNAVASIRPKSESCWE